MITHSLQLPNTFSSSSFSFKNMLIKREIMAISIDNIPIPPDKYKGCVGSLSQYVNENKSLFGIQEGVMFDLYEGDTLLGNVTPLTSLGHGVHSITIKRLIINEDKIKKVSCQDFEYISKWFSERYKVKDKSNSLTETTLPITDREKVFDMIVSSTMKRYMNRLAFDKKDPQFIVISGPLGIGRSRVLDEFGKHTLVDGLPTQQININLSYGPGSEFGLIEQDKSAAQSISLRILYQWFGVSVGETFKQFCLNLSDTFDLGTMDIFSSISIIATSQLATLNLDLPTMINIGVDDLQRIPREKSSVKLVQQQLNCTAPTPNNILKAILFTRGWPGPLSMVIQVLKNRKDFQSVNTSTIVDSTLLLLQSAYGFSKANTTYSLLVALTISGLAVKRDLSTLPARDWEDLKLFGCRENQMYSIHLLYWLGIGLNRPLATEYEVSIPLSVLILGQKDTYYFCQKFSYKIPLILVDRSGMPPLKQPESPKTLFQNSITLNQSESELGLVVRGNSSLNSNTDNTTAMIIFVHCSEEVSVH
ncbi:hypothetical protein DFA_07994 [Cavenderia fasciculata]|uniref:Uncharacterized protein n=1 Tax=Cavenderia fasciculata TaxID=261658 RepID=F4Q4K4_CACFS|nr:uncharacterized protein DFA_07994 [Cavenderia fasciculata]EGG17013.1 hypothetical protein DFA_07994 [Cavenderia fasciculata]|eukprot:XP_004355497.1 hypothetical protein DFA_07994 [Cavenderia fasciculata]